MKYIIQSTWGLKTSRIFLNVVLSQNHSESSFVVKKNKKTNLRIFHSCGHLVYLIDNERTNEVISGWIFGVCHSLVTTG